MIAYGSYAPYALEHERVFAYLRELPAEDGAENVLPAQRLLVLTNFYGEPTEVEVPAEFIRSGCVLVCNYKNSAVDSAAAGSAEMVRLSLRPYEALALLVEG